jgi:DNA-binding XRE family transcriptional regulator
MLRKERERLALSSHDAARRLGVSRRHYRDLEDGNAWPDWTTYDRIERLFGWPQTFLDSSAG